MILWKEELHNLCSTSIIRMVN